MPWAKQKLPFKIATPSEFHFFIGIPCGISGNPTKFLHTDKLMEEGGLPLEKNPRLRLNLV